MSHFDRFIKLTLVVTGLICAAQAQVNLSITATESGSFSNTNCSQYSPQFNNPTVFPDIAVAACVNTITLWVTNKGTAPTAGLGGAPVVVNENLVPASPKKATVLATNGYCPFPGGCTSLGSTAPDGWNCVVGQGTVSCSRTDVLVPGQSYPPIVIRALVEDFNSGIHSLNSVTSVAGGVGGLSGLTETDQSDNFAFETGVNFPPTFPWQKALVTVHSVPEGLLVMVDGTLVRTPRAYLWNVGDFHSIEGDYNGVPFPGNAPWVLSSFSTGGIVTSIKTNTVFSTFPSNVVPGKVFYEQVTAVFTKPPVIIIPLGH